MQLRTSGENLANEIIAGSDERRGKLTPIMNISKCTTCADFKRDSIYITGSSDQNGFMFKADNQNIDTENTVPAHYSDINKQ